MNSKLIIHCVDAYHEATTRMLEDYDNIVTLADPHNYEGMYVTLHHAVRRVCDSWDCCEIHIHKDFAPYSFTFTVKDGDRMRIHGGIIYTEGQGWSTHT